MPDIDTAKEPRPGLGRLQAEVKALTIEDEKGQSRSARSDQVLRQSELAKYGLGLGLETAQYTQHGLDERDWEFEPPHLEGDREVEEIPFRELSTAAAPASITNIGHHNLLLAEVDQLVLRNAQQLRGLGQCPGLHL